MPQNKKSNNKKAVTNHVYRGCRDAFLIPAPGTNPSSNIYIATSSSGGAGNFAQVLAPVGLTSTTLGASSYTAGVVGNVTGPPCRGLYYKAIQFQWYRITRARFIFVGNVGSTVTGSITLAAYTDTNDVAVGTTPAVISSPSTKTFDFANSASKELSVPIPVDTSWKKVGSELTVPGNVYPFTASTAGSLAVINTVNDLACGAVQATWVGFTSGGVAANTNIGSFFLEYDIELKSPIDFSLNV